MTQQTHESDLTDVNDEATEQEAPVSSAPDEPKAAVARNLKPSAAAGRPKAASSEMPRGSAAQAGERPQPSFMSATGEQLTREELLARYRRQRSLPDDPFEDMTRPQPRTAPREQKRPEPRPAARYIEKPAADAGQASDRRQPPRNFTLGQTFAIAAAMALAAGAGAGVLSARFAAAPSPAGTMSTAPVAAAMPAQPSQLQLADAAGSRSTTIDKKPVSTATLQVSDVAGETNSFIPLALHAEPAGLNQDMLLKISGVPEGAYLTSGHREDDQVWSLSLAETKNVKLVVPEAKDPQIDLAVAAFEPKTGELAAPVKTMTVALKDVTVEPTSAPPPDQTQGSSAVEAQKSALPAADAGNLPVAIPPPQSIQVAAVDTQSPEDQQLLAEADSLFKSGDVRAARKNYERAWGKDGSAAAAFGLGRSYDPVVIGALALKNAKPDKAQAIQWYQRAASAGNADAAEAIVRLQLKP